MTAATTAVTGVIDSVRRDRKGFKLSDGDTWYSVYDPANMQADRGDTVTFKYKTKGSFYNAQGVIKPAIGALKAPPSQARQFPVLPTAPERTINRQNALTAAVNALPEHMGNTEAELNAYADQVIALAYRFEHYTTGDDLKVAIAESLDDE